MQSYPMSVQCPQSFLFAVGCRLVINILSVLQWLCGYTTWLWCRISLGHILVHEFGEVHLWNAARGHCCCCCQKGNQAHRSQLDVTWKDSEQYLKSYTETDKPLVVYLINFINNTEIKRCQQLWPRSIQLDAYQPWLMSSPVLHGPCEWIYFYPK